jgi:N-methylhydantoinase B
LIFAQSGAGGGWGDPLKRVPERVLDDVRDGYVSINGAKQNYGVVVDGAAMTIDHHATTALRAKLAAPAEKSVA